MTLYAPIGNYGNALQLYALYKLLTDYGFEVERLRCPLIEIEVKPVTKIKNFLWRNIKRPVKLTLALAGVKKYRERLRRRFKPTPEEIEQERIKALELEERRRRNQARKKVFDDFFTRYTGQEINSTYSKTLRSRASDWVKYKYIMAGSDPIWNKMIVKTANALKFYYLFFAGRSQRINYASSFGVISIEAEDKDISIHKQGLSGFDKLSCREQAGCDLIKSLTGQQAQLVLDSTLLLSAEQWRRISRRPSYDIPEHYALAYFFSNNDYKKYSEIINQAAGNLEIIHIFNPDDFMHFITSPEEFIWLIDHADYVFTYSFHGTAFAINFNKNFITFGKDSEGWFKNVFSRIDSLLSSLGLSDRAYEHGMRIPEHEINYYAANEKLNALREKSIKYLRECLKI
ncbi:MAG: polysaccharide pyruvyl transferase family protein [Synergistaceae bacterium]|nr:polysaccharide pyruvyl transferase family protein [Synergistaceae bacterium]